MLLVGKLFSDLLPTLVIVSPSASPHHTGRPIVFYDLTGDIVVFNLSIPIPTL